VTLHFAFLISLASATSTADYRALVDEYRKDGRPQVEQLLGMPSADIEREVTATLAATPAWTWEELRGAARDPSHGRDARPPASWAQSRCWPATYRRVAPRASIRSSRCARNDSRRVRAQIALKK
jgi:hypothetical protein